MNIKVVDIDLVKNIFQLCILLKDNSIQSNRKINRTKFLHPMRKLSSGTLVTMGACGTSHYWARTLISLGLNVKFDVV